MTPIKTILFTSSFVCSATFASAATISPLINGTVIAAPAIASQNGIESRDVVTAFNEVVNFALPSRLNLADGIQLTRGDRIDSHMFFFNRGDNGNERPADEITASFEMSERILGIIRGQGGLNRTDAILGAAGTTYEQFAGRGLRQQDVITLVSPFSFEVDLKNSQPGDWFRVITVTSVPVPAGAPLMLAGLGAFGFMRRKAKQT
jgi:hypothetical protein